MHFGALVCLACFIFTSCSVACAVNNSTQFVNLMVSAALNSTPLDRTDCEQIWEEMWLSSLSISTTTLCLCMLTCSRKFHWPCAVCLYHLDKTNCVSAQTIQAQSIHLTYLSTSAC